MTDKPYETGFLEEIINCHFGGGPFAIIYATNGRVYGHTPGPVSDSISEINIQGPFSLADAICPGGHATGLVNPDGSGSFSLSVNSWQRVGTFSGGSPISDIVAKNSVYLAWLGQYVTTTQLSMTPGGTGGGSMFWNIDGYLVVDLSKLKSNFSCHVVMAPQVPSIGVAVATWKDNLKNTVLDASHSNNSDSCLVTTSKGAVDIFNSFNGTKPANAVDYAHVGSGGGAGANIAITVDIKTLKVTCTS